MNEGSRGTVLLVDDDPNSLRVLTALLEEADFHIASAFDVDVALRVLKHADADAIITDLKLPGRDGTELLDYCSKHYPDIPVILLTAYGSLEMAVELIKQGAFYYFVKPPDFNQLRNILSLAVERRRLKREIQRLKKDRQDEQVSVKLTAIDPEMQNIVKMVEAVKDSQSHVLIYGETGTGKEVVARALHYWSTRASSPFVAVNCAAIPKDLIESELFGYEKGAFTGAVGRRVGKFVEASGGTLFLDEVGELDLAVQGKLLRVLQDRQVHPLGSNRSIEVNFRLVCATNRDLWIEVQRGMFREDIFYRINVVQMKIPPLRDRRTDIPVLASQFLQEFCAREGRVMRFSSEVLEFFQNFAWPGNVRQLKNTIERAVVMTSGKTVTLRDLPPELLASQELSASNPQAGPILNLISLERGAVAEALLRTRGNKSQAAKLLGISRKALYKKMDDYQIHLSSESSDN